MADKGIVARAKVEALVESIRAKTGITGPLSFDAMKTAVDNMTGSSSGGGASVEWANEEGILFKEIYGIDLPNHKEIYFNTNLSIEEVYNIINNETSISWFASGTDDFEFGKIINIAGADPTSIWSARSLSRNYVALININYLEYLNGGSSEGAEIYFSSAELPELGVSLVGWNLETNSFSYNKNVIELDTTIKNRKLISNLPFDKEKQVFNFNGIYKGSDSYIVGSNQVINIQELLNKSILPRKIVIRSDEQDRLDRYGCEYFFSSYREDWINETIKRLDFSNKTIFNRLCAYNAHIYNIPLELQKMLNNVSIQSIQSAFYSCYSLQEITGIILNEDNDMNSFCENCDNLKVVNFEANNVKNMSYAFQSCDNLETVQTITMSLNQFETCFNNAFYWCKKLTNLTIKNIKSNLQVGSGSNWGHLLTLDSLIGLCKECINTGSALTLTVGSANLEKIQNSGKYFKFVDSSVTEIAVDEKGEIEECDSTVTGSFTITDYMAMKNWTLA